MTLYKILVDIERFHVPSLSARASTPHLVNVPEQMLMQYWTRSIGGVGARTLPLPGPPGIKAPDTPLVGRYYPYKEETQAAGINSSCSH